MSKQWNTSIISVKMKTAYCLRRRGRRVDGSHTFHFRENIGRTMAPPPTKMEKALLGEPGTILAFLESEFKQFFKENNTKLQNK